MNKIYYIIPVAFLFVGCAAKPSVPARTASCYDEAKEKVADTYSSIADEANKKYEESRRAWSRFYSR